MHCTLHRDIYLHCTVQYNCSVPVTETRNRITNRIPIIINLYIYIYTVQCTVPIIKIITIKLNSNNKKLTNKFIANKKLIKNIYSTPKKSKLNINIIETKLFKREEWRIEEKILVKKLTLMGPKGRTEENRTGRNPTAPTVLSKFRTLKNHFIEKLTGHNMNNKNKKSQLKREFKLLRKQDIVLCFVIKIHKSLFRGLHPLSSYIWIDMYKLCVLHCSAVHLVYIPSPIWMW